MHKIPLMPHSFSFYGGHGLSAAIHATAALRTIDSMIEWRWFDRATIYGDVLSPKGGRISVPLGPDLELDRDPDLIRAYRWK
jgi:L-alanine-DL-glutamate epimerase-like enolase superfamily enzyme